MPLRQRFFQTVTQFTILNALQEACERDYYLLTGKFSIGSKCSPFLWLPNEQTLKQFHTLLNRDVFYAYEALPVRQPFPMCIAFQETQVQSTIYCFQNSAHHHVG